MEANRVEFIYSRMGILPPKNVTHVTIDPSVKVIEASAFIRCTKLIHVELVEGLEKIDEWAFEGCTSLENVFIPSTINRIGYGAFEGCTKLIRVELVEGLEKRRKCVCRMHITGECDHPIHRQYDWI
jgi:hypothetical protein